MKALIQRVSSGSVVVDNQVCGEIEQGLVILLGVEQSDDERDVQLLANKVADLRIFSDEGGKFNYSLRDINGQALIISQFTLCAQYKKGRRPSFTSAAAPDHAKCLYQSFSQLFANDPKIAKVANGIFGADMKVQINNDGPVTIQLDSAELK